jgi:hypothetical protein
MPGSPARNERAGFMRKIVCLLAALCGGCAAQAVLPQAVSAGNILDTTEVLSAANKAPGYYPGYADLGLVNIADYKGWLAQNQSKIDEIQARISAIREGEVAPGCIGEDRYTCAATLAQRLAIADYSHDRSLVAEPRYDVNGKPVTGSEFEFEGYEPRPRGARDIISIPTRFVIKMGRNARVSTVAVKLPIDPTVARTQDEYDATDAYQTISALTAKECPALSREDVAKWIENIVKPKSKSYRGRVRRGTAQLDISKKTVFCGRTFQFGSLWVSRGSNIGGAWSLIVE